MCIRDKNFNFSCYALLSNHLIQPGREQSKSQKEAFAWRGDPPLNHHQHNRLNFFQKNFTIQFYHQLLLYEEL